MKTFASFQSPELREWRKENLEHSTRDISVLIPEGADPEIILNAINTNKQLAACEISDIYRGLNWVETEKERKGWKGSELLTG